MIEAPGPSAISAFSNARVLCVGDVMLDRFVAGSVERISPEAPVLVLKNRSTTSMLGGAGNVARNLAALGAQVSLIGCLGNDETAAIVRRALDREPAIDACLITDHTHPTTLKVRHLAAGRQILRVDTDPSGPLSPRTIEMIETAFHERLAQHKAVILSDYGKGALSVESLVRFIAATKARGIPVIVDPKGDDFARYRGATLVTPNRKELAEGVGRRLVSEDDLLEAARSLVERHELGALLVTRGEDGMTLIERGVPPRHIPTEALDIFDVAGAGDTVVATIAAGMAAGLSLPACVALSNIAAGIVVRKVGVGVVSQRELRIAARRRQAPYPGKLVDTAEAVELIAQWRSEGAKVGFTNGCFDLFHAGHIELLRKAREKVDKLVVGLNSDESVRRLKGAARPINTQEARARVMAAIEYVDAIVVFPEATPRRLIEALRPDVLMKGSDYTLENVVGADFVRGYGGRVELVELVAGFSSTAIMEKVQNGDRRA